MRTLILQRRLTMLTLLKIQDFMSRALRGDTDVPPSVLQEFAEDCKASTADQMARTKREWRLRMSGLGRPVCQQILDKHGIEESMSYNTLFRFLFGDITESIVMLIMESSCKIVQTRCTMTAERCLTRSLKPIAFGLFIR